MAWFTSVPVNRKLTTGFAAVVALLLVVSVTAYLGLHEVRQSEDFIQTRSLRNVNDLATLRNNFTAERLDVSVLLELPPAERRPWTDDLNARNAENDSLLRGLMDRLRQDPARYARLTELIAIRDAFRQTRDTQVLPLIDAGNLPAARRIYYGVQLERYSRLQAITRDLEKSEQDEAARVVAEAERHTNAYVASVLVLGTAAVVFALLLGIYLSATMRRFMAERRRIEGELRTASLNLRSLIEASLDPMVTISTEGKVTDVNRASETATGVGRDRLIGSDFADYFTEPERARQGYKLVLSQGFVRDYPLGLRHVSGRITEVSFNASVFKNEAGRVQGVFAAARDVTERREMEAKLTRSSAYTRSLIEASLDPLVTISPQGKITDVNAATINVTGVPRDSLIGTDFSDYFTEPEKARAGYREVFEKGFVTDYPLTIRHRDGHLTDVLYNASVYRDEQGNVVGVFAAARDVTESKRLMREYAETRGFLDNILQSSIKYSLVGMDLERRILSWNEGARRNYGYTADEVVGRDSAILYAPEEIHSGAVDPLFTRALDQGLAEAEFQRVRKDGSRFTASVVLTRRNDAAGRAIGYLLMSSDITDRKNAEERIRDTARYVRSLIEASLDPLVTISREGKITDVNKATEEVTGVARDRLIGSDFADYFTDPEKARQGYQRVLAQGFVRDYALTLRSVTGKTTEVLYNSSVFRNETGEVQGVFAAARDVTERRQLENQLTRASAYTRSLIEASLDPLVTISPEGKITDVNKATEDATGVPRERLIGSDFANYFTDPEMARRGYQQVLAQGFVRDYALSLRNVGGQLMDVLYNASVFRNEEGRVQGVFAAARDVTERRRLEIKLTEASAYTRSLIEASLDPLVTISPQGKITDVNKATEEATGVSRERLVGSDFANYFTEPEKARQGYQQVLAQGFVRDYALALRHVSGRIMDVLYNATVFRDAGGELQGVFAAARDVTERKELERKVQERSARLERVLQEAREAVSVLTASAREILTVISQLATGASEAATSVSETTTTVEEVRQTAQLSNQKAKDIAESGQNAAQVLQAGQRSVEAAVTEMTRIRDQMGTIAETIVTLSEQSQAIGEITGTVNDLAEQSNLLAVNAAIEAAKAGEQGKGFAVVAQEIKSLAEQSKQATAQVKGLLADIQKAIANAVMATEQTSKVVDTGVTQSRQAGESIQMAVNATQRVANASSQIAISSQQQLTGVDQVAMAMESINKASIQNAQSTKQVESVAQNLHELSQKLKALVGP